MSIPVRSSLFAGVFAVVALGAPSIASDCDGNGVPDTEDLCAGAPDADGDGYLDSCEFRYGNFDLDDDVDGNDLGMILNHWGHVGQMAGDLTGDSVVDASDLSTLLCLWGPVNYSGSSGPAWATVLSWCPDPAIVTNATLREALSATGLPWRVLDTGTNIEMVLVPPGTFQMGCSASTSAPCGANEYPVHEVTLTNAFYIGRYEVTQSQWQAAMGSNPSYFASYGDSPSRPVEKVSWNTIQGFLTATGMRLPTEAEWEYSYRAGTTTAYHSGPGYPNGTNDTSFVPQIAWYGSNSGNQTHAVGGKAGNGLGIHDMAGNVWEWVNDWYDSYPSVAQTNPTGPATGGTRVLRGGAWYYGAGIVRSSYRGNYTPDVSYVIIGFRVARAPF